MGGVGSEHAPRVLLLWGPGWGPKVLRAHSLLVNLKRKTGDLNHGRRKDWPKWSVIEIDQGL